MDDIMDAALQDVLDKESIVLPTVSQGGGSMQSIGGGLYQAKLPDGTDVIVNEKGEIVG
nr:hypothetical protein [uncultured Anaerotignum sp.]